MAQTNTKKQTQIRIKGNVSTSSYSKNEPLFGATVVVKELNKYAQSDEKGNFLVEFLRPSSLNSTYTIVAYLYGFKTVSKKIDIKNATTLTIDFNLEELQDSLKTVVVEGDSEAQNSDLMARLNAVDGMGIYESKKSEVIVLNNTTANLAANNSRQIYAKVAGLNVWESDGAGIQLGIGARGLSPNRTANFNTRQNGYDISADALGYPESYYTPPVEAVERIELVRGAASLQYGTQFGGMLNFVMKDAPKDDNFAVNIRQTVGSYGFTNSFVDVGGNLGKTNQNGDSKVSYYGFFQYKRGDGWRENSGFDVYTGFAKMTFRPTSKLKISVEYTGMNYLAQQAGGLTDVLFEQNPRQSIRDRNWFAVNWNLGAVVLDYKISNKTKINSRTFGLLAGRRTVGNLDKISTIDFGKNRTLIDGDFKNFGNETRLLHHYSINFLGEKFKKQTHAFVTGFRYYNGFTTQQQGDADATDEPNFTFLNSENLENSSYEFPNQNASFFIENVFNISDKWSITPGIRAEYIKTGANGFYKERVFDFAGNLISEVKNEESLERPRSFILGGIGVSYKPIINDKNELEIYANFSQNYRSVTFSDLRIQNPNLVISPDIKDESGYNTDLGFRGKLNTLLQFDVSLFYLNYNDRISQVERVGVAPTYTPYRFRGNIAQARIYGIESLLEFNIGKLGNNWIENILPKSYLGVYLNTAILKSKYVNSEETAILGRQVELVPPVTLRTGLQFGYQKFKLSYQYSFTKEHFTDATNVIRSATAVSGIIPSYYVMDLSMSYSYKWLKVEGSINNLTNNSYFTRRADGYPGPGIIPADGRAFFLTLGAGF
ncbi:outer membrane receptor for Fe3+-dicitrate [Bernardetia litoralis DSM 6794]|uniref:Outer membrane receptor for Fe3+-dicitrate n=2 Tax=Bernardetia litoralis TaxID=999 RepID=I4AH50_BERLS|nr:outer membrane receptor for Fe3+-dicitrate [Bernardetia litoralis DSM 6794]